MMTTTNQISGVEHKIDRHYSDVIMSTKASQITSVSIIYPIVFYFRRRSKKTWKLALLAFVRGIHQWPVISPHKWPVTRKMFPFDDVIIFITALRFAIRMEYSMGLCDLLRSPDRSGTWLFSCIRRARTKIIAVRLSHAFATIVPMG